MATNLIWDFYIFTMFSNISYILHYLRSMHSHQIGRACIIIPVLLVRQWQPRSYSKIIQLECTSAITNLLQHNASLDQNLPYFWAHTYCHFLSFSWAPRVLEKFCSVYKIFFFLLRESQMRVLFPLQWTWILCCTSKARRRRIGPTLPYTTF